MKDTFYFQHDYNARNDDKLLQLRCSKFGNEGVAVFWYCLETMAERGDGYIQDNLIGGLSLGYGVTIEWLEEFLNFCIKIDLFKKNEKGFFSSRIVKHLKFRKSCQENGRKGANSRWKAGYSHPNSPPNGVAIATLMQRKGKERKEKELPLMPPKGGDGFEGFWEKYPKKKSKGAALRAWAKLSSSEKETILQILPRHCQQEQWKKDGGQFIPYPATWLNARGWEDDLPVADLTKEERLAIARENLKNL